MDLLPYRRPFLFVDRLLEIDDESVVGEYTFRPDEDFYRGHFPENPLTPGVILIECMAQIGLVAFGIFLSGVYRSGFLDAFAFTSTNVDFLKMVRPGERVTVSAEKVYWRFGKLKVRCTMKNQQGETVCKGNMSGMVLKSQA